MSIKPLPSEVVAQIKSSITITSLNGVVCELVKNSLDAGATKLDITVDYGRGSCTVEDDGLGILPSDFRDEGGLGNLYHSSKLNSQLAVHGGRGIFLSALSAMALLSIVSHHHLHRSYNSLSMYKSEVVSRQTPTTTHEQLMNLNHGTRVVVRDLFGNMPVRVKQRVAPGKHQGSTREWQDLKRDVVLLLLAWNTSVALTIRDAASGQQMTIRPTLDQSKPAQVPNMSVLSTCRILSQGGFISQDEKESWVAVGASTTRLDIGGTISLSPAASKSVQFLSFGMHPLCAYKGQSIFHDEINRLFSNSAFGIEEGYEEISNLEIDRRRRDGRYKGDGYTIKDLKGVKKGVERWPMFYINIGFRQTHETSPSVIDDIFDDKGQSLNVILELLQAMILKFLQKHHYHPKNIRGRHLTKPSDSPAKLNLSTYRDLISEDRAAAHASSKPSASCSTSIQEKKKPLERPTLRSDPLGTNIVLPSFRQNSKTLSIPLEGWSNVKQGAVQSRPVTLRAASQPMDAVHILRPSTAPHDIRSIADSDQSRVSSSRRASRHAQGTLIAQDGKIIRPPFEDAIVASPRRTHYAQPAQALIPPSTSQKKGDDMLVWINPVTKVASLISRHTGHTIKPSTSSSTSGRQSSRLSSSLSEEKDTKLKNASPWIRDIVDGWENPIFLPTEPSIPLVTFDGPDSATQHILHGQHHHCSQVDIDRAFKESASGAHGRISKGALKRAEIVSQVDQKFILVKLKSPEAASNFSSSNDEEGNMLVLIDQHAADERVRVEALMQELCCPGANSTTIGLELRAVTTSLEKPLKFEIPKKEIDLLDKHKSHFENWGIIYDHQPPSSASIQRLTVYSLPPPILERCKAEPRLLIDLIRNEVWKVHGEGSPRTPSMVSKDWLQRIHSCPQGILDMVKSRACRSAIMFNDILSNEQCEVLVVKLAECQFPFQCAHGRPSLVPLVDLRALRLGSVDGAVPHVGIGGPAGFGTEFRKWKEGKM